LRGVCRSGGNQANCKNSAERKRIVHFAILQFIRRILRLAVDTSAIVPIATCSLIAVNCALVSVRRLLGSLESPPVSGQQRRCPRYAEGLRSGEASVARLNICRGESADPDADGSKTIDCRHYKLVGENDWQLVRNLIRVPHPSITARRSHQPSRSGHLRAS
jgi:hypothetical protein